MDIVLPHDNLECGLNSTLRALLLWLVRLVWPWRLLRRSLGLVDSTMELCSCCRTFGFVLSLRRTHEGVVCARNVALRLL